MFGPCPAGHWTGLPSTQQDFMHLRLGQPYRVVQRFVDFDGAAHEVGESWTFLGKSFAPYDDGLSLFVSLDGTQEWHIRLCWHPQYQGPIIDSLESYFSPGR
jgi:hypothetical protein